MNPTAEVEALGQIAATSSASITATATTRLDLDLSQYDLNLTLSPSAKAVVGSQADVDAATFTLSAAIDGELDVDGNDGSRFDQTGDQSAVARIDLGADVDVTGSGDSAMTVTATDSIDVDVELEGLTLAANIFETMARSDITKTTSVLLGAGFDSDDGTVAIETGQLVKDGSSWYRYIGSDSDFLRSVRA